MLGRMRTPPPRAPRRVALLGAVAACAALGLTACGSAGQPLPYEATGIDGLMAPTPSPQPSDFAEPTGNQHFPTAEGQRWSYELRDPAGRTAPVTVTAEGTERVAGVRVRWLATTTGEGRAEQTRRDAYATDSRGNVWWMASEPAGSERGFSAGTSGEAGLLMPSELRVGDAFVHAASAGERLGWSTVVRTDARVSGTLSAGEASVELEGSPSVAGPAPSVNGAEARRWYAPGLGLVREERADGFSLVLVEHED